MTREEDSVFRILDANANRATEGLRTLEESLRFHWQNPVLTRELKELRHALASALQMLDREQLLIHRDTQHDLGTSIATIHENRRDGLNHVVVAASNRTQQALRNLEEFGKVVSEEFAQAIKPLRYLAYDLFAKIELYLSASRNRLEDASLYVLIDCRLPLDKFLARAISIAQAGVDILQIRDKEISTDQLIHYAQQLVRHLDSCSTLIVINDRVDVASYLGLGAHLGQSDLPYVAARKILGAKLPIGVSTHSLVQALEAEGNGADYVGCGPTFPSSTKLFDEFPGLDFLRQVAQHVACPAFAIGGITLQRLDEVMATGIRRVAVSHAVWCADDAATAAATFKDKLRSATANPTRIEVDAEPMP